MTRPVHLYTPKLPHHEITDRQIQRERGDNDCREDLRQRRKSRRQRRRKSRRTEKEAMAKRNCETVEKDIRGLIHPMFKGQVELNYAAIVGGGHMYYVSGPLGLKLVEARSRDRIQAADKLLARLSMIRTLTR